MSCTETIPYRMTGSGSKVILFIHGFMDEGKIWDPIIKKMNAQDYCAVTVDLPGMGCLNEWDKPLTLRGSAVEIIKVIKAVGKPVVLVGQSMGAQISEIIAIEIPEYVEGIVMVTPIPLAGLPIPDELRASFLSLAGNAEAIRAARANTIPGLTEEQLDDMAASTVKIRPDSLEAILDSWVVGDEAGKTDRVTDKRTLFIVGALDPFASPELVSGSIAPRFTDTAMEVLENTSHWAHVEQPDAVADMINTFVSKL